MPLRTRARAARIIALLGCGWLASTVMLRAAPFFPPARNFAPQGVVARPPEDQPAGAITASQNIAPSIPELPLPHQWQGEAPLPGNSVGPWLEEMQSGEPYPLPPGAQPYPGEIVPLENPAQPVDNLPVIMVPTSPFLPMATDMPAHGSFPIISETWMQRPISAGMFTGILWGDVAIGDNVHLDSGLITGGRFGWDWNDHLAWEGRLAFATVDVSYPGTDLPGRDADAILFDVQLQLSPFSTPRFKPFFSLGAGLGFFDLMDHRQVVITETVFTLPFGLGIKYRYDDWVVFRLDVTDNVALGERASGLRNMHNISVVGGLEIRFGGYRRDYWPWNLR